MTAPKLFINIVAWNSMAYLPDFLLSLEKQTCKDFRVLIIDNASTDKAAEFVREHYPGVVLLRNARNLGFAAAHNQGIRYALEHGGTEDANNLFVLVANPDIIFEPDCIERLLAATSSAPRVGSFGPKLLKAHAKDPHDQAMRETVKTNLLDSTGLIARKSRAFADRGAGEEDRGQYDNHVEIFGVSGALALYRASALAAARFQDEFFDQDFFCYKEDVDLAWRLRKLGWEARFVPEARAYHYRAMAGKEHAGFLERVRNRRAKSRTRSFYSTRNHWNLLMKNEQWLSGLLALPWIVPQEFARFVYVLFFEPRNVSAFFQALARVGRMWKKRVPTTASLRSWFV